LRATFAPVPSIARSRFRYQYLDLVLPHHNKRVSCREIEDRVLEFDGILEPAVIGAAGDVMWNDPERALIGSSTLNLSCLRKMLHVHRFKLRRSSMGVR